MGEPGNVNILQLTDENGHAVDGVYFFASTGTPSTSEMTTYFTRNLVPDQRSHDNEILVNVGDVQYRVMNPADGHLATAICCKLRSLFVKHGSKVFYLANDDSSYVTISHLSDIVGTDGIVFVAVKYKGEEDRFDALFNGRSNVVYLDGANTTNPGQCRDYLRSRFNGSIDVLYCDVGGPDQVQCLSGHASVILENGGHFVAFLKAEKTVLRTNHEVVVPPSYFLLSEMNKLDNLGFKRFKANDFGSFSRYWACVVGWFHGATPAVISTGSASASSATVDP